MAVAAVATVAVTMVDVWTMVARGGVIRSKVSAKKWEKKQNGPGHNKSGRDTGQKVAVLVGDEGVRMKNAERVREGGLKLRERFARCAHRLARQFF